MSADGSTKVAVFGTGGWAQRVHLPVLTSLPDVEVVACVDTSPENGKSAAAMFGVRCAYRTLDELFENHSSLSLLVIAAPDHVQTEAARAALLRGVAVFCEKPLGNDAVTSEVLANIAEKGRIPATVGYSFRYSPAIQALRADLDSGRLGDVWLIELAEHNPQFHPLLGKPMNWKGDPAYATAGALLEYGSHVLDLCLWLLGPVSDVSSNLVGILPGAQLDDIATLQLRFASGASGTLLCSWVLTGGYPGIKIRLHTSQGLAEVELSALLPGNERYVRYHPDGSLLPVATMADLDDGEGVYARLHLTDLIATIRARAGTSSTLPTFRQAAFTHRVLEAGRNASMEWRSVRASPDGMPYP